MIKKQQQGFTLIELMIVIAIIGILAAIAIPQYQDYVTRSKVTEGLNLAATAKTAVATYVQSAAKFPSTNASAGLPTAASISGEYVGSISVGTNGVITVKFATPADLPPDVQGSTLILTPKTTAGSVAWSCNGHKIPLANGGSTFAGASGTIPTKYLPQNCRP